MPRLFFLVLGMLVFAAWAGACQVVAPATPSPTLAHVPVLIANVVTADGIVEPAQSAELSFQVAGRVSAVKVNVGDHVKAGDVLATLDDMVIQQQITQAKAAVAVASSQLNQVQTGATLADRAAAQAALDAAQKNYDKVRSGPTADQLTQLKAQLDNAKALVGQAQAAYDRIGGASNPFIAMTPESAQLQQATNNYNAAAAAFHDAANHPTAAELAAAQAQLDQAKQAIARLDPTKDALSVAQGQLQNAQAALDIVKANDAEYRLIAPFDGIIGQRNINVGDAVVPGTSAAAFTIGDVSQLHIETTNLAEVDVPKVHVGQSALVTLDAFPGTTFAGKVSRIAPSSIEHLGDRVFTVWIDLDQGIESGLRWGMSATAKITVE